MRSTNIIIILVLMNSMAGVAAVALPFAPVPAVGGDDAISQVDQAENEINPSQSGVADDFTGGILSVSRFLDTLRNIVFAGPEMLRALGTPGILVSTFEAIVGLVVAIDMAEIISGRMLS